MTLSEQQLSQWLGEGQQALEAGQFLDAAQAFTRLCDALPGVPALASMAGNAWQLAGRTVRARRAFIDAWRQFDRTDIPGLHELGSSLLALGAPDEARDCFTLVARARPRDPAALSALASATRAAGDPAAAWPLIEQALSLSPKNAAFLLTAGQIRHSQGQLDDAAQWLSRAATIRPDHAPTKLQQGFTSLLRAISSEGWALFESRALPAVPPGTRDWRGESLDGQSIVVIADQGVGDQFHFVRYVAPLRDRGASRVLLSCAPATVSLFRASGIEAFANGEAPATDWSVPLLSLPHRLGVNGDYAFDAVPYLRVETDAARANDAALQPASLPRVGLVWKGNPEFLSTTLRDFDVSLLPQLTDIPCVTWHSLQYGEAIPAACPRLHPVALTGDWAHTAQILTTLDAVVSVDTSVVHLAGAMGIRAYLLLPYSPDWRWGLHGELTPWYPTVTLVRQPAPRDWHGAVRRLDQLLVRDLS